MIAPDVSLVDTQREPGFELPSLGFIRVPAYSPVGRPGRRIMTTPYVRRDVQILRSHLLQQALFLVHSREEIADIARPVAC